MDEDWTSAPFRSPGYGFEIDPFAFKSPSLETKSESAVQSKAAEAARAQQFSPSAPSDDAENQVNGRTRKGESASPSMRGGAVFQTPAPLSMSSDSSAKGYGSALKERNHNASVVAPQSSDKDEANLGALKPRLPLSSRSPETRSPLKEAKIVAASSATAIATATATTSATTSAANDENQAAKAPPPPPLAEAKAELKPAATPKSKAEYKAALKAKRASEKAVASFAAAVAAVPPAKTKPTSRFATTLSTTHAAAAMPRATIETSHSHVQEKTGMLSSSNSSSGASSFSGGAGSTTHRNAPRAAATTTTVPMTPGMLAAKRSTPSLMAAAKARVDAAGKSAAANTAAANTAAAPKLKTATSMKSASVDDVSGKSKATIGSDVTKHNRRVFRGRSSSLTRSNSSGRDSNSTSSNSTAALPSAFAIGQRRVTMPSVVATGKASQDVGLPSDGRVSNPDAAKDERVHEMKDCSEEKVSIGVRAPLAPIVQSPSGQSDEVVSEESSNEASVPSAAGATTATTADTTVKSEQPSLNWRPFADTEVRRPRPRMRGAPASAAATAALLPGVPPAAAGGGATAAAEVGKGALAPVVPDEVKATKVVAAAQAPPMSRRGFGGSGLSFQPLQQQFGVPSASSSLTVAAAARLSAGSPGLQAAAGRVALSKSMFEAHNNKMKMETSAEVATKAAEGTEITNNLVDSGLSSAVKAYTNADGSMATATHTIPSATKHSPVAVPNVLAAAAAELSASLSALGGSFSGIGGDYKDTRMISAEESGEGALLTPWAAGSFATDDTSSSNLSDLSALDIEAILAGAGENSAYVNRAHDDDKNDESFGPGGKLDVSAVSAKLLCSPILSPGSTTGAAAEIAAAAAASKATELTEEAELPTQLEDVVEGTSKENMYLPSSAEERATKAAASRRERSLARASGGHQEQASCNATIATGQFASIATEAREDGTLPGGSNAVDAHPDKESHSNAQGRTPAKEAASTNNAKAVLGVASPLSGRASTSPTLESPPPNFGIGTMNDYRALTLLYTHAGKANHKSNRSSPKDSSTNTGEMTSEISAVDTPRAVLAEKAFPSSLEVSTSTDASSSLVSSGDAATRKAAEIAVVTSTPVLLSSKPKASTAATTEQKIAVSLSPENMGSGDDTKAQQTTATAADLPAPAEDSEPSSKAVTQTSSTPPTPPPAAAPPAAAPLPISPGLVQRTAHELRELFAECAAQRAALASAAADAQTAQDAFSTLARSIAQTNAKSKASKLRNQFRDEMKSSQGTASVSSTPTPNVQSVKASSENSLGLDSHPPRWWKASGMIALTLLVASAGLITRGPTQAIPSQTLKNVEGRVPLAPLHDLSRDSSDALVTQLSPRSLSLPLPSPEQATSDAVTVPFFVSSLPLQQSTSLRSQHLHKSEQAMPVVALLVAPAPTNAAATPAGWALANADTVDKEVLVEPFSVALITLNDYAFRDITNLLPATQKMVALLSSLAPTLTAASSSSSSISTIATVSSTAPAHAMQISSKVLVLPEESVVTAQKTPRLQLAAQIVWRGASSILRTLSEVASLPMAPVFALVVLFGLL